MARKQFTVTVSEELGRYLEERAEKEGLKKSAVVGRALKLDRQRLRDELLVEGYREMGEHDLKIAKEFANVDVSTPWPDY